MKKWEGRFVIGGFTLAGLVFLLAALKPLMGGEPLNATFLLLGVACVVVGVVAWRGFHGHGPPKA